MVVAAGAVVAFAVAAVVAVAGLGPLRTVRLEVWRLGPVLRLTIHLAAAQVHRLRRVPRKAHHQPVGVSDQVGFGFGRLG